MSSAPDRPAVFLTVVGFAFAVEGALYSAVTPILPLLTRTLDMTSSQAGLMLSSYSAGIVAGSLLCVLALRRLDARTGAVASLIILSVSTLVFAWAQQYELALGSRLLQGVAGGATWTAAVSWLLRMWPLERRGEALGLASGPAVIGTIAGPAIGTVSVDVGIRGSYTVVAALCLCAAACMLRMPRPSVHATLEETRPGLRLQRQVMAVLGAAVLAATGVLMGLINLAAPLVLVDLGAKDRTAGLVFVVAAILTVVAARPFGILVDSRGASGVAAVGLLLTATALPAFAAGLGVWATGALVVVLLLAMNLCYISSGTLLSREGERGGWTIYSVTAVSATVWGVGETAGALSAGLGLDHLGSWWTSVLGSALAALVLVAVVVLFNRERRNEQASADGTSCLPDPVQCPTTSI